MGIALVASPDETEGSAGRKPVPKTGAGRVKTASLLVRGVPEWKSWIEELAEFDRSPSVNDLIDRALVAYAREVRFPKSAPKR